MEVQKLVLVQSILLVGIQLTLFARISSCAQAFLSEEGKCCSNSNVKTRTRSDFPCFEKYITESYFEKHDRYIDSSFENFIANELSFGLSGELQKKLPRLPTLQRYLTGEGSHRRLSSSIKLRGKLEAIANLSRHMCKAIIIEKLPPGIFVDPFELQHLLQRGVFTDAAVFGDLNLELPSVVSNRSVVEVHMDVGYNVLTGHSNGLEINIDVPLHARYPPLGGCRFSTVEFSRPDLFLRCHMEGKSCDDSCLFLLTDSSDESQTVAWEIPCGIKKHSGVVAAVTFVSAVLAASLIIVTSVYYPHDQKAH